MRPQIEKYMEERKAMNKLYHVPQYKRLKYIALATIAIVIVLLFATIIWMKRIISEGFTHNAKLCRIRLDNICVNCCHYDLSRELPAHSKST